MDPIHTWLDPAAVRQLADQLLNPSAQPTAVATGMGFNDSFVGFDAGPPAEEHPSPAPTPSFPALLMSFAEWLRQNFRTAAVFILDGSGEVIFNDGNQDHLHVLARNLVLSPSFKRPPHAPVHLKISTEMNLILVPTQPAGSNFLLAALMPERPELATLDQIVKKFPTP